MDALFSRVMDQIFERHKDVLTAIPKVITITMTSALEIDGNRMPVDLDSIRGNERLEIRTRRKKKRNVTEYVAFSNSTTVMFGGTKAMKIFTNGRIHCTGCKTVAEAEGYVRDFIASMPGWSDGSVGFEPFAIVTLNTCIRMRPTCVSLDGLNAALKEKAGLSTRYNPDIYQALIAKVPCSTGRKVSLMIFYTGTLIIAGVRTPAELDEAFGAVFPFMFSDEAKSFEV